MSRGAAEEEENNASLATATSLATAATTTAKGGMSVLLGKQGPRTTVAVQAPQPETCAIRLASEQAEELTLSELSGSETTFIMPSPSDDGDVSMGSQRMSLVVKKSADDDKATMCDRLTQGTKHRSHSTSPRPVHQDYTDSSSGSETPFGARTAEGSKSKSSRDTKLVGKPKKKASKAALREFEKRKRSSLLKKGTVLPPPESAPARRSWQARIPPLVLPDPKEEPLDLEQELQKHGEFAELTYENKEYESTRDSWIDLQQVGKGAFGNVRKMRHTLLNKVFAVKQLRDSMDPQSRRQLITDLRVIKQSTCQWIVQYYGFCCTEGEMWIYMEHMMLSLDDMYKTFLEIKPEGHVLPEQVMGVIAVSVLRGLDYLYEAHRVMHRDVKPSNILVGFDGSIRVCDFGVSTFMIKSIARTHAGSERYLPPERLNPTSSKDGYGLTSDVWAYGLTLLEMACLNYPYPKHPLKRVVNIIRGEPPRIPDGLYSADFCDLTAQCLTKLEPGRPYYRKPAKNSPDSLCLLDHSFIIDHGLRLDNKEFDMVGWWQSVLHNPDEEE